jgi:hypothetical protein
MLAARRFARLVDSICSPNAFSADHLDAFSPTQPVSKRDAHDRGYLRLSVAAEPPSHGSVCIPNPSFIIYYLRDLSITLQGHPAIFPTTNWNVRFRRSWHLESIISRPSEN